MWLPILTMSAKLTTLGLFKIKAFLNKSHDIIISVHDVTSKIILTQRDSNYIVDVVMWPKFGNSKISTREVTITSISWGFVQKNHFFEEWSCFKSNNLGVAQIMDLKFNTSVAEVLGANPNICRSCKGKTGGRGGLFAFHPE